MMESEGFRKEPNCTPENFKDLHYCELICKSHCYGAAIDECYQDQDGYLFVSNGEYGSQVNFCPVCGYEAIKKVE